MPTGDEWRRRLAEKQRQLDECRAKRAAEGAEAADRIQELEAALEECEGDGQPPVEPQPRFYNSDSLWNRKRDQSKPADPKGSAIVANIKATHAGGRITAYAPDSYGHPIFYADATDPVFQIDTTESWSTTDGQSLRVPSIAAPAPGTDGHLTIIQSDATEFDFWQARIDREARKVNASVGGKLSVFGDGTGGRSTAFGHGLPAGVIMADELRAGRIPHRLFTVVPHTNGLKLNGAMSKGAVAPGDWPAMGQEWYVDMSDSEIEDFTAGVSWKAAILTAARDWGMVVCDTGGGPFKLDMARDMFNYGTELGLPLSNGGARMFQMVMPWDRIWFAA